MSQGGILSGGGGSGAAPIETLTGNSGGPVGPDASFNVNTVGTGSVTVVGSPGTNTLTAQLTGLTNHNVLIGAGSATITKVAPSATSGIPLVSTGAASDPAFGTATVPGGGTGLTTLTAHSLYAGNGTSPPTALGVANNGFLPIGQTGLDPVLAPLTAGVGISIVNGVGSITISTAGGGFTWTAIGASQSLVAENGYFCTTGAALSLALPAVSAVGDTIEVVLDGSTSWTITQPNAATRIRIGNTQTTLGVGGSLASSDQGDSIELVCETANARWVVISMVGNITVV